jgi:hypothetical protein
MKYGKLNQSLRRRIRKVFGMRNITANTEMLLQNGVAVFLVNVDSDLATDILTNLHPNQRRLSAGGASSIAVDMVKGRYPFIGDPLRFDTKGRLVDGQHRLRALIRAGATLPFLVVFDLPEGAIKNIDSNRARTNSDHATIHGRPMEQRTGRYQTLLNGIYTIERYTNHDLPAKASFSTLNIDVEEAYSKAVVELQDLRLEFHSRFTSPVWSMMHYAYAISPRKARKFVKMVAQRAGYRAGTAPHAFVEFLMRFKEERRQSNLGGVTNQVKLHLATLRAMRAYFANEPMNRVDGELLVDEEGHPVQARDDAAILWAAKELRKRQVRQESVLAA